MEGEASDDANDEAELPLEEDEQRPSKRIADLTEAVNQSSATARTNWIFLLALMGYLFVAVASVTHKDLLLDNPIKLPVLNVEIPLSRFFLIAPFGFLVIYAGVLLQHSLLADKCRDLHAAISKLEEPSRSPRRHPARLNLSTYFLTQIMAGRSLPAFRRILALGTMWITLGLLPLILLVAFQVTFLPFHDADTTLGHKVAVAIAACLSMLLISMLAPARVNGALFVGVQSFIVFFAVAVATVPGSFSDRLLSSSALLSTRAPIGTEDTSQQPRYAFRPTAALFEGEVNFVTGEVTSYFSRNLVVPDAQLTSGGENREHKALAALRNRDLRYANLDRSDLRGLDFTGTKLNGASLRGSDFRGAKFRCERHGKAPDILQEGRKWRDELAQRKGLETAWYDAGEYYDPNQPADWNWLNALVDDACVQAAKSTQESAEGCADLSDANLTASDLRGADIRRAVLDRTTFSEANMRGVDLQSATICDGRFSKAKLEGANLSRAILVGASFTSASLHSANLSSANLTLASFWLTELAAADLSAAWLHLADLRHANLSNADLSGAMLRAADLRLANLWTATLPAANAFFLSDLSGAKLEQPSSKQLDELSRNLTSIEDDSLPSTKADRARVTEGLSRFMAPDQNWPTSATGRQWVEMVKTLNRKDDALFYTKRKKLLGLVACRSVRAATMLLGRYGWFQPSNSYYEHAYSIDENDTEGLEDPRIVKRLSTIGKKATRGYDAGYTEYFFDDWMTPDDIAKTLNAPDCGSAKILESEYPGTLASVAENANLYRRQQEEGARNKAK